MMVVSHTVSAHSIGFGESCILTLGYYLPQPVTCYLLSLTLVHRCIVRTQKHKAVEYKCTTCALMEAEGEDLTHEGKAELAQLYFYHSIMYRSQRAWYHNIDDGASTFMKRSSKSSATPPNNDSTISSLNPYEGLVKDDLGISSSAFATISSFAPLFLRLFDNVEASEDEASEDVPVDASEII